MVRQLRKDNVLNIASNTIRLSAPLQLDSIVDGVGLRCVLWTQGCLHNCKGCHNPQTHDVLGGYEELVEVIIAQLKKTKIQTGLTLSGGEPFLQAKNLLPIVLAAKQKNMNVWAYSGYLFEVLLANQEQYALLKEVDVLIDGPFVEELSDPLLTFRGSSNQRMIDVQASLIQKEVVFYTFK